MIEHISQTISSVALALVAINAALLWRAVRKNEERIEIVLCSLKHAQKEVDNNRGVILRILDREERDSKTLKLHAERLTRISAANRDNDNVESEAAVDNSLEISVQKSKFATRISQLLCKNKQRLLDEIGSESELFMGEEKQKIVLDWADKFIDAVGDSAVRTCLVAK